ncbi:hypothetical protein IV203_028204 [Nitzschia inconspicua]|uniref:Uncharacterized protein n=1 Tax=Nitzschia inconspicua TaxID=303405 RepID=A0A9K3KA58_9STRA|nr:hypothetical protein IV203_028204 [Nitzschia inconspicua]
MMADEFARKHSEGECVCVDGMEFLSQQPESWLSIEDGSNEMVIQAKHLHDLTWVQKRVVVKGLPLPEIRRTEEARPKATNGSYATNCEEQESISVEQESIFEVECHIPDTIRDLQLSQQNAIASRREQRNAGYAQRVEIFRAILNLAEGRGAWNERIDAHLEEMFVGLTNDIASEKENQKRIHFLHDKSTELRRTCAFLEQIHTIVNARNDVNQFTDDRTGHICSSHLFTNTGTTLNSIMD